MTAAMDSTSRTRALKDFALGLGVSVVGVADIAPLRSEIALAEETKNRFPLAVVMGKRLSDPVLDDISDQPTALYFHHYRQMNFFLDRAAFLVADHIQSQGFAALAIPASQLLDGARHRGHLSHKHAGRLAGLGWLGRSNLLINPGLGARFRLVTVLTDLPLVADSPLAEGCGACRACIGVCPAGAIKERQEDFDHQACFEKLKEFRARGLVSQHICGVCVKACRGPK